MKIPPCQAHKHHHDTTVRSRMRDYALSCFLEFEAVVYNVQAKLAHYQDTKQPQATSLCRPPDDGSPVPLSLLLANYTLLRVLGLQRG